MWEFACGKMGIPRRRFGHQKIPQRKLCFSHHKFPCLLINLSLEEIFSKTILKISVLLVIPSSPSYLDVFVKKIPQRKLCFPHREFPYSPINLSPEKGILNRKLTCQKMLVVQDFHTHHTSICV